MNERPDLDRIRDLLGHIADSARRLAELSQLDEGEFLDDPRNAATAKYLAIVGAAAAIDLCNHIVARRGGRAPTDYADCFTVLTELGIVNAQLAAKLRNMTRFRNLLVHQYARVDDRRVREYLSEQAADLDKYAAQIREWLRREGLLAED